MAVGLIEENSLYAYVSGYPLEEIKIVSPTNPATRKTKQIFIQLQCVKKSFVAMF
jgi:hypothetical protein